MGTALFYPSNVCDKYECSNYHSHLNDEKHSRGGVKGTVVESDDGGAMSRKQVAHLSVTQRHRSSEQNMFESLEVAQMYFCLGTQKHFYRCSYLHVSYEQQDSTHSKKRQGGVKQM